MSTSTDIELVDQSKETINDDSHPDMFNRDPNDLNAHVGKTLFEDIIGEPEGAHSAECVWRLSYKCFTGGKNICYLILTYICAAPLALCWGCEFACITFAHIWYVTPCFKVVDLNLGCCKKFYSLLINCCYAPCMETVALIFSKIHVTMVQQ